MSNPRRTPMTRPDSALTLKTNMVLRKGATFHSPTSPESPESAVFIPPSLPRRSQTNLDDVIDAHRRRVALTLGDIDKALSAATDSTSSPKKTLRDNSFPIPMGLLSPTLIGKDMEVERRVLRPRPNRCSSRGHSDSGIGTSIASSKGKRSVVADTSPQKVSVKTSAVTRSAASTTTSESLPGLSARATSRIYEHTLKPLLANSAFKDFHHVVLECPRKISSKQIICLRDVEKTLLLTAQGVTKAAKLYLDFCLSAARCIQATAALLSEPEQRRPKDAPYNSGYFIDLVDQIRHYAQQIAEKKSGSTDAMDVDIKDEVRLHGGISVNGRPAELVRIRNGKAISIATGEPVELEDEPNSPIRFKRSASQELADDDEIMRSMARRKKNAPPEEYAPKKCREPGCNKEFKRPCDLTKHEKTHSRPWKCSVPTCKYHEYGWPTEKEMQRHFSDKHSSAPPMYECLYKPCPYKSKRESNCKQHMEKAHGWTYVRTKTNGKKNVSHSGSVTHATPPVHNMPTPTSEISFGVATPPQMRMYDGIEFPGYMAQDQFGAADLRPDELQIDFSPIDNASPSTDSGMDNSSYQDISGDFTHYEDLYNANVHQIALASNPFSKEMAQQFAAFSAAELNKTQPVPHISPIGQGNAMLFTPSSLAEVDEGFDDFTTHGQVGPDFCLFPPTTEFAKQPLYQPLFGEIPSIAAGYSQPTSQDLLQDWRNNVQYHASYPHN
ncbi:zinc finger transcription factor ace1 [Magnaporthiopsis poae ATCC 64411]|uniref:Zinc finger transcription factor ace1 n=1 Tax=Magnaporthiopsis poae (strain ATCC 64411 / 73-15) TaxID=644358 RepID=A0A0C4DTE6_MAGP6|nr:zinc finger transcription factor ace1 [Magnaporthiopsis poae ATCC 64411]